MFSCSRDKVSKHPNPPLCVENIVTFVGHQNLLSKWHGTPTKQDVLLASASRDGTANVWDVMKKSAIANFRGCHGVPLRCIAFSPVNQCMICTGSDDQSIVVWDMYSQSSKLPPEKNSSYHKDFLRRMKNNKIKPVSRLDSSSSKDDMSSDLPISKAKIPLLHKKAAKKETILPLLQAEMTLCTSQISIPHSKTVSTKKHGMHWRKMNIFLIAVQSS